MSFLLNWNRNTICSSVLIYQFTERPKEKTHSMLSALLMSLRKFEFPIGAIAKCVFFLVFMSPGQSSGGQQLATGW